VENWKYTPLTDKLYNYLLSVSLREPPILKKLRQETQTLPEFYMQISPDQGQFLALLIQLTGASRVIEVGTFTGYSSLAMALALPGDGSIIACDINKNWTDIARRYWTEAGIAHKMDLRLGMARGTLKSLIQDGGSDSFDFIFIDADKTGYSHYYELSLDLLRPGGLMALDNTLYGGVVADPDNDDLDVEMMREVNEKIAADDRVDISLLPIADGLTLVRKR
jgi:predicted O-methyltransferase YrrM